MSSRLVIAVLAGLATAAAATALPYVEVEGRSYPQSVGGYVGGSLERADAFRADTAYAVKLFPTSERNYGSLDLVTLLASSARAMREIFPDAERLQVGDLSRETGGTLSGHGSHSNGLDVDLAYFRTDGIELDPARVTEFPIEYVVSGRLSPKFDLEKNLKFFRILHSTGRIGRIFVDPVIKVRLCQYATKVGRREALREVLRLLRPWPHHGDHFHVRLTCPKGSTRCRPQAPAPAGDGCAEAAVDARRALRGQGILPIHTPFATEHDGC